MTRRFQFTSLSRNRSDMLPACRLTADLPQVRRGDSLWRAGSPRLRSGIGSKSVAAGLLLTWSVLSGYASGQQAGGRQDPNLVTRVYPVADMLLPTPDYEYEGQLPTTGGSKQPPRFFGGGGFGGGGGGGGGFGGGGGGGGGGVFSVPSNPAQARRSSSTVLDADGLIGTITSIVDPESWGENGGPASIRAMGALIFVRQTEAAHTQIQQLLDTIRREGGRLRSVTVEARWLLLDSDQLDALVDRSDPANSRLKDAQLEKLTREKTSYRGQITCFSGQQVFIVAGRRQSVFSSVIPVVGSGVGFQPVVQMPNVGILLQVRPTLLPHERAAILDVRSTVTDWQDGDTTEIVVRPDRGKTASAEFMPADHVSIKAQELATTLRVPLGEAVLVGGLTLVPMKEATREGDESTARSNASQPPQRLLKKLTIRRELEQLYIVVKVTAAPQTKMETAANATPSR